MNRKAQFVETMGAVILLIGSIIGIVGVAKDVVHPSYIADMREKTSANLCVYESSCNQEIEKIPVDSRKPFDTLEQANKEGYILCSCN